MSFPRGFTPAVEHKASVEAWLPCSSFIKSHLLNTQKCSGLPNCAPHAMMRFTPHARPHSHHLQETLACTMPSADFCLAVSLLSKRPLRCRRAWQTSQGKNTDFLDTTTGFTRQGLDGYGLRYLTLARPPLVPTYPISVRWLVHLLDTSFRPHLAMTPLVS